jgi:hypothetical protein
VYFFVFYHEPVFCDVVFCFGEFFVWAHASFSSTAVKFTIRGCLECPSFPDISYISKARVLSIELWDRSVRYFRGFLHCSRRCLTKVRLQARSQTSPRTLRP